MTDRGDEKCDERCHGTTNVRSGGAIYMSAEKVVYWNVPLTGELKPIRAIPPIRIKAPICEALEWDQ